MFPFKFILSAPGKHTFYIYVF